MHWTKILFFILFLLASPQGHSQDTALYRTISDLDSVFFHAYNTCDLAKQEAMYADTIEFFHDKSGLDTSKQKILANTKKYICGKVNRELVKEAWRFRRCLDTVQWPWGCTDSITSRRRPFPVQASL